MNTLIEHPIFFLLAVCFLVNIPLGSIRENYPKFSNKWFILIHASIPLILYLRIQLNTPKWLIPECIFLAIVGQILGSRLKQKYMSHDQKKRLKQIPDFQLPQKKQGAIKDEDISVVLLNMGGPKTIADVEPFLRRLFMDPLIIRFPLSGLLQAFFADLLIRFRLKAVQRRYNLIGGGSPILQSSMNQVRALNQELKKRGRSFSVDLCFNYSFPLPEDYLKEIKSKNKRYVLPLSLYTHYSDSTTGSNMYYLQKQAQKDYAQVQFLKCLPYYLHDGFIQAFVDRIQETLKPGENLEDFYLLFSAHGTPVYFQIKGDIYSCQVSQSIAQILAKLNRVHEWAISYQSAVGPLEWLKPSTDDTLEALAREGIKKIIVIPISFVNDHIETLCEIDIEYREVAHKLGFTDFRMSKAIESHPKFIEALADCVENSLLKQERQKETVLC